MENQSNKIIEHFKQLDRSLFMDTLQEFAYLDEAIPIGYEQTISQPSLVLEMTLALDLQKDARVLEIGTGSGYQTAMLAPFVQQVFTVERIKPLADQAKKRLQTIGFHNIEFKLDDGSSGWKEYAPYDRIIVTAAAAEIPFELTEQLAKGGKMIIPVGPPRLQELLLLEKNAGGTLTKEVLGEVRFVPLKGKYE
ncbi:protein-L-isoaspartate(D-aspartate) O-methyltransferase [Sporosarcina sp. Te-1]|uniref:protein-L-isoaspartate(D-aspartate) O-methyltransferase n=1 Tax=Sporosarcina sp. Te-1 TaxID=2818390 RepID=UPI001A9F43A9|nr:protein-L-isoaspartate(D-aspartate) O-methyltransferase [Sporosarcina sp. Te-1]QTD40943.1 protein-L-isoaspartate(D-aspartate) O-methyltransferase [Sporosarcina sp. Te-1]